MYVHTHTHTPKHSGNLNTTVNAEGGDTKNDVHLCAWVKSERCFTHKPSTTTITRSV